MDGPGRAKRAKQLGTGQRLAGGQLFRGSGNSLPSGRKFSPKQEDGRDGKKKKIGQPGDSGGESDGNPEPEKLMDRLLWTRKKVDETLCRCADKAQNPSDRSN